MERQDSQKKLFISLAALLILATLGGVFLIRSHRSQEVASSGGAPENVVSATAPGGTKTASDQATSGSTSPTEPANPTQPGNPTYSATEGDSAKNSDAPVPTSPHSVSTDSANTSTPAVVGNATGSKVASSAPESGTAPAATSSGLLGSLKNKVASLFGGAVGNVASVTPVTGGVSNSASGARVPASNDLGSSAPDQANLRSAAAGDLVAMAKKEADEKAHAAEIAKSCFTEVFNHKPLSSHSSGEACSSHRNLIKLKYAKLNPKSVCVRVNGTPVRYQLNKNRPDEILLGAIAGPTAKISVRYCMEKTTCSEDCAVPKDEFLEAIGGSDDGSDTTPVAKWDSEEKDDGDVAAKIDPELKRELASHADLKTFDGWVSEGEQNSCGTHSPSHAAKTVTGSSNG